MPLPIKTCSKFKTPTITIMIDHCLREPWISIGRDGLMTTWAVQPRSGVEILHTYSRSFSITTLMHQFVENLRWRRGKYAAYSISYFLMYFFGPLRNYIPRVSLSKKVYFGGTFNELRVNFPETQFLQRWKKLAVMNYFLANTSSDILIITTPSAYLNVDNLIKLLGSSKIDLCKPLYAGPIQKAVDGNFVSGAFLMLNRESVKELVDNRRRIPVHTMDDVAFGVAMKILNIQITNLETINLDRIESLNEIDSKVLKSNVHFRLKSGSLTSRDDVRIFSELHERLTHV